MKQYTVILKDYDLKVTPQRINILKIIDKEGHISIEDLYTQIKEFFPSISLATLYKNINTMCDTGLIKEIKIPHSKSKYELSKEDHSHLLCMKCGKVEDIKISADKFIQKAENLSGYKIENISILFKGVCPSCQ
ncbi:Fur family transcriptional regulator [Nitrosophilus alvini]|uniref:Fur family transcriptional regulator n=1 Tax=Nitrosophilus alvini TaxID=2714855 RepID=UPI00190B07A7|nr:transcriptional repressor [Nitrosophilus alvini]